MRYKVVRRFKDMKHGGRIYEVGDVYPADGFKAPTKKRLEELAGGKNKYGQVFIEEVAEAGGAEHTDRLTRKTSADKE